MSDSSLPPDRTRTDPDAKRVEPRRFHVPWGLLGALGVYSLGVAGYAAYRYGTSPTYQASVHYQHASKVLGRDSGRSASREQLLDAYRNLLEAARLRPDVKELHQQLESLNWRFEERRWNLPEDLRKDADALGGVWLRMQAARTPVLAVGLRDEGWEPAELLAGPARLFNWSLIGAVVIFIAWGFSRLTAKRVRFEEKEEYYRGVQREIDEREQARRNPRSR